MKRLIFFLAIVALSCVGLAADDARLEFDWAFVRQAEDGSIAPLDFKERVGVVPGDLFKIYIQPVGKVFIYLFLHDASSELSLLFPAGFSAFEAKTYRSGLFFIPEGDDWFTLDGVRGTETFYLVASADRLGELESRYAAFESVAGNPKSTAAARSAAVQKVLDELSRLRKQHSTLATAAEKPVTIAGGTRGVNASVQQSATRITGIGFYNKTFRLEH